VRASTRIAAVCLLAISGAATSGAAPASACADGSCAGTVVAINLAAGSLTLSAPASVTITGTLGAATSFSQTMSTVEVQDNRGTLAGWSLTALTSGDLVTSGSPVRTISLGRSNAGGPLVLTTGAVTPVGLSSIVNVAAGAGGSLNPTQPVAVASAALGFGGGTYDMTPRVTLTPPPNTFAGNYSTTVAFTVTG
jgi:hypothetical protein